MTLEREVVGALVVDAVLLKLAGCESQSDAWWAERGGVRLSVYGSSANMGARIDIARDPSKSDPCDFPIWRGKGEVLDGPWVPHVEAFIDDLTAEVAAGKAALQAAEDAVNAGLRDKQQSDAQAMVAAWTAKPVGGRK